MIRKNRESITSYLGMLHSSISASFMLKPFHSLSLSDGLIFFQRSHLFQKAYPSKFPKISLQHPPFRSAIPYFSNDRVCFFFFALFCPLFAQSCSLFFKQLTISCYGRLESPISSHLWPSKMAHPQGGQKNNKNKNKNETLPYEGGLHIYSHIVIYIIFII